ncbi:HXXEE domain-containing protein [Neobacillus rhizosphaerae]|uniref:HXXEE domain-containing protein n=1 Tax=Neobacillus rhizosphaerae TaxID=2880965 RepID=UPI003D282EB1
MLEWLNTNLSIATVIWLFPLAFLLHDFEEIIFVEAWFEKKYVKVFGRVPRRARGFFEEFSHTTAAKFSIPVVMQLIMYIIAAYLAVEQQTFAFLVGFNVILFLHVFTHIGQSLYFRTYALGVGTAVLIIIPYTLYLFYRLLQARVIGFRDIFTNAPYGLLTIIVVLIGHKVASKILPSRK